MRNLAPNTLFSIDSSESDILFPTLDRSACHYLHCSLCNKICDHGSRRWLEPSTLLEPSPEPASMIHSICPSCLQGQRREVYHQHR